MSDAKQQGTQGAERGTPIISVIPQVGLVAAIAALAGASCCALPLLLMWLGASGALIANLGPFVAYRQYVTAFAIAVVAIGWFLVLRRRTSGRTLIVTLIASALLGAALLVAQYEVELTRYLVALRRR